jgi:hypothetical protein
MCGCGNGRGNEDFVRRGSGITVVIMDEMILFFYEIVKKKIK